MAVARDLIEMTEEAINLGDGESALRRLQMLRDVTEARLERENAPAEPVELPRGRVQRWRDSALRLAR